MDSELKIRYYVYDLLGKEYVTDPLEETAASCEEGRFADEGHGTMRHVVPGGIG